MVGVIIGVILLLLLIGLVVLQAAIEWGGFDPGAKFAGKEEQTKQSQSKKPKVTTKKSVKNVKRKVKK